MHNIFLKYQKEFKKINKWSDTLINNITKLFHNVITVVLCYYYIDIKNSYLWIIFFLFNSWFYSILFSFTSKGIEKSVLLRDHFFFLLYLDIYNSFFFSCAKLLRAATTDIVTSMSTENAYNNMYIIYEEYSRKYCSTR